MYRLVCILAATLFLFMLWIIYLADSGNSSLFFYLVQQWPYGDKACHLLLYGLLTLLVNLALELKTIAVTKRVKVYVGTLAVTVFAVAEELSQAWIPSRTLDSLDLAADAIGIALFSLASYGIGQWYRPKAIHTDY
ncbi:VanZ family protein [Marinobacter zhejiangensis]|uniref:VanZ like family protein n=1 Tax=Marinobacter zhejiangensis TaxID=488535 RepID=A0A1I4M3E7_9GAMM|nr:VanZ family protein [Marinobacter zhejiangensis]SFL97616.1 hypothetical protein SAMN04487963_0819 [Marinobacter zhejiangensis]